MLIPEADLFMLQPTTANPTSWTYVVGFLFQKYGTQPTLFKRLPQPLTATAKAPRGAPEMPPPEVGMLCQGRGPPLRHLHTEWGWCISTEAWCPSQDPPRAAGHQGAGNPDATAGRVEHPPFSPPMPAKHKSLHCWGPWLQSPWLQILGPNGHSLATNVHPITSRDTGIKWFHDCDSYIHPAVWGELTPSMSFKYWIGSMPNCGAHRLT